MPLHFHGNNIKTIWFMWMREYCNINQKITNNDDAT
jgi:hypothetical protein